MFSASANHRQPTNTQKRQRGRFGDNGYMAAVDSVVPLLFVDAAIHTVTPARTEGVEWRADLDVVAAAVALEGEPSSADVELELARVYATLLTADREQSRYISAVAWASRLARDWRLGVLSDRDLQRLFASPESDLQAVLPASAIQAQALLALSQGRTEAARALAERGREVSGKSQLALEHQAFLDAALDSVR